MNETYINTEHLSLLLDGELNVDDRDDFLSYFQHDSSSQQKLDRYALIGMALKTEKTENSVNPTDFLDKVQQGLSNEPIYVDFNTQKNKIKNPYIATAIAASLFLFSVVFYNGMSQVEPGAVLAVSDQHKGLAVETVSIVALDQDDDEKLSSLQQYFRDQEGLRQHVNPIPHARLVTSGR